MRVKLLPAALLLTAWVLPCFSAETPVSANPSPAEVSQEVGIDQKLGAQVPPDIMLVDEDGAPVPMGRFFGQRPVLLSLVYYECPMLCTQVLNGVVKAVRPLKMEPGIDYDLVTVSFDPDETPELARQKKESYLASWGRPGETGAWRFLTGDETSIRRLADAVGFRYRRLPSGDYAHGSGVFLLTPGGNISRVYYGIEYGPKDLRLGIVEASGGKIGNAVDQVLLLCFEYDPTTGQYGFVVTGLIRAVGVVVFSALFGLIGWSLWRERKAKAGS